MMLSEFLQVAGRLQSHPVHDILIVLVAVHNLSHKIVGLYPPGIAIFYHRVVIIFRIRLFQQPLLHTAEPDIGITSYLSASLLASCI